MSEIVPIKSAEPIMFGIVKIVWMDGHEDIVDLRPVIGEGELFAFVRTTPTRFRDIKLAEFGHSIFWLDDDGEEIDFGADSLRRRAERQAEILRLAS